MRLLLLILFAGCSEPRSMRWTEAQVAAEIHEHVHNDDDWYPCNPETNVWYVKTLRGEFIAPPTRKAH